MAGNGLTNRTAVRRYILERVRIARPGWTCTAVSPATLDQVEAHLRVYLDQLVHQHPTLGKTFRP